LLEGNSQARSPTTLAGAKPRGGDDADRAARRQPWLVQSRPAATTPIVPPADNHGWLKAGRRR
jgi:hypothetical protein